MTINLESTVFKNPVVVHQKMLVSMNREAALVKNPAVLH